MSVRTMLLAAAVPVAVAGALPVFAASVRPAPKACDVLTKSVAERVLGSAAPLTTFGSGPACGYQNSAGDLRIVIGPWSKMKSDLDTSGEGEPTAVGGLGDAAYFDNVVLYVRKGTVGMEIELSDQTYDSSSGSDARMLARDKIIARAVLPRL